MYHEFINVDVNNEINTTNENIIFNKLNNKQLSKMNSKSTKPAIPEKSHMEPSHNIRFTKVLTKYSTEYNNYLFIQNLCLILNMDKKDLFSYFIYLKKIFKNDIDIYNLLNDYEINKLDIQRIYKYLNIG